MEKYENGWEGGKKSALFMTNLYSRQKKVKPSKSKNETKDELVYFCLIYFIFSA